jgi:SAM-dependent methyltransferase
MAGAHRVEWFVPFSPAMSNPAPMPADRTPPSLATLIQEVVRPLATATPPPRGLPYLGLDHPSGTALGTLDQLARRGIFRKYELVLDLGTPFGAVSRWLVSRLGGDAVAAVPTVAGARAAAELTRRSPARQRVRCLAGDPTCLPLPAAHFTHVWGIETLSAGPDPAAVLREAFRVVRPGGWLGIQEIVPVSATDVPPWQALRAEIEAVGFFEVDGGDVTADAIENAPQLRHARARFDAQLGSAGTEARAFAAISQSTYHAISSGASRVVQVVARRPG